MSSVADRMPPSSFGILGIASSLLHVVGLARPDSRWIVAACVSTSSALSLLHETSNVSRRELSRGAMATMLCVNLRITFLVLSSPGKYKELAILLAFLTFFGPDIRKRTWLLAVPLFFCLASNDENSVYFLLSTQLGAIVASFLSLVDVFETKWLSAWTAACVVGRCARVATGSGELGLIFAAVATLAVYFLYHEPEVPTTKEQTVAPPAPPPPFTKQQSTRQEVSKTPESKKVKKYFGYIRGKLANVSLNEGDESSTPSQEEIDEVVARVMADVEKRRIVVKDRALVKTWAIRCLVVHKRRVDRSVEVCRNLVLFRERWRWPLLIEDAGPIEAALRSGMHTVLPGRDLLGRRVVTYSAAALSSYRRPIGELQQMMCFLLEKLVEEPRTQQVGVSFLVDLGGASLKTLRSLGLDDVRRGMDMLTDAFPCRLRAVYVINLPTVFAPAASLISRLLPAKVRARLHVSRRGGAKQNPRLLEDVPLDMIPTSMGGTLKDSYWEAQVDRYLVHNFQE